MAGAEVINNYVMKHDHTAQEPHVSEEMLAF